MFTYDYLPTQEQVRFFIQDCESQHIQQVCYSTFHDALTQVCFGCKKIRSNLRILDTTPLTLKDNTK